MIILDDNEKDIFIKKEFQKDNLISKKVDNLFQDFFEGKIDMEEKDEKVINFAEKKDKHKNKLPKMKKILSTVASVMIIFLAVNVYAASRGYNNIFFMIRNLITPKDTYISGKDNILVDKDITISYEPILLDDGITLSVNRFVVKDSKASLFVTISEKENSKGIYELIITDKDGSDYGKELSDYFLDEKEEKEYSEQIEINLKGYNDNIDVLRLYALRDDMAFAELQLNLSEKTIDIISNGIHSEMEKLSEIELKETLGKYVMVNYYNDVIINDPNCPKIGLEKYINSVMTDLAIEFIKDNGNSSKYSLEKVNKFLEELCGRTDNTPLINKSNFLEYNNNKKEYEVIPTDSGVSGMCININNIEYKNNIYCVTFTYCYPLDNAEPLDKQMSELDIFETTFNLKVNENYKYAKYQIQDVYNIKSNLVVNAQSQNDNNSNTNSSNSVNSNTTNNSTANSVTNTSNNVSQSHVHEWTVVKRNGSEEYHTTLNATHTAICTKCGETKTEPHNFGSWYTLYDGTAWSLWCNDCGRYIYTEDYNLVKNSGYEYEDKDSYIGSNNNTKVKIMGDWYAAKAVSSSGEEVDLTTIFGTGIHMSNKMTFGENNSFSYGISITTGYGGEQYSVDGNKVRYSVAGDMANAYSWYELRYNAEDDTLVEKRDGNTITYRRIK